MRYSPDERDLLATERKVKALWTAIERAADDRRLAPVRPAVRLVRLPGDLCPAWGGTPPPLPENAAQLAVDPAVTGQVEPADE